VLLRIDRANASSEPLFGLGPQIVSLRKQPSGIESDEIDIDVVLNKHLQDDLVLQPEAGRKDDAPGNFLTQLAQPVDRGKRLKQGPKPHGPRKPPGFFSPYSAFGSNLPNCPCL